MCNNSIQLLRGRYSFNEVRVQPEYCYCKYSQPTTENARFLRFVCGLFGQIYSAASDGMDSHSCRIIAELGTSMSCPIVAGAAAMVGLRKEK